MPETVKTFTSVETLKRNYNLDLMKVLACIAVVSLHAINMDIAIINAILYYLSGFAVPVFFMASGYMLLRKNSITFKYVFGKVIAILRIVLLWNILFWLTKAAVIFLVNARLELDLFELLNAIINGFVQNNVFWHFWYLGALIIVYLCLPFVLRVAQCGRLKEVWFMLIIIGVFFQVISMFVGYPFQSRFIQTFRLWTWLQYFILGGLLCRRELFRSLNGRIPSLRVHGMVLAGWSVLLVIYQYFCGRYVIHNTYAEFFYDSMFTVAWNVLLFTFVLRIPFRERMNRAVSIVAPLTLTVYIIHPFVIIVFDLFISVSTPLGAISYFGVVSACSFIIAFALSKLPFGKYLTKL